MQDNKEPLDGRFFTDNEGFIRGEIAKGRWRYNLTFGTVYNFNTPIHNMLAGFRNKLVNPKVEQHKYMKSV